MGRLPGDGAVAGGDEQEARTGEQGVPYMETVYGTKEELQAEDAPLRKGLMWLQKGKLFSRYVKTHSHGLPWIPWLPVKRDEPPDCSNSMSCRHTPVNTSDLPALLSYHIRVIWSISPRYHCCPISSHPCNWSILLLTDTSEHSYSYYKDAQCNISFQSHSDRVLCRSEGRSKNL